MVALVPVPESAEVCLAEAEELLSARDRITSALAARVGRVHRAGEADRRFFRVRRRRNGGLEGEFYLPVEAAARMQHLLDVYAKPKAEGDDRTPSVRNADAVIAFLENKIATELLVLVTAESLPDDPPADEPSADEPSREPAGTTPSGDSTADPSADHPTTDSVDPAPSDGPGPDLSGTGPSGDPTADASVDHLTSDPSDAGPSDSSGPDLGSCGPGSVPGSDACVSEDFGMPYAGTTDADSEPSASERPATGGPAVVWPHFDAADGDERADLGEVGEVGDTRQGHADEAKTHRHRTWNSQRTRAQQTHAPDPPTEPPTKSDDTTGAHTEDSPSGDCPRDRRAHGSPGGDRPADDCPAEGYRHASWTGEAQHETSRTGADAPPGVERDDDAWPRAGGNSPPGVWLRGLPGLILATGHLLPVSRVHRLARTSTLVRIVMDAGGQVLDMGRKVRLATPAQRRAVFARYATCWVDGCPLPATMCQVDHAEDWCSGGLTDLKLLGPACQFHNRDRYRHPTRYTRRKIGDDRWAFTYRNPRDSRNLRSTRRRL